MVTKGSSLRYGPNPDASLNGLLNTACSANGTCAYQWIRLFIEKDLAFKPAGMSFDEYEIVFHKSVQQYKSILGTDNPDLSAFRDAGGKMTT
jgi:hypothetical protein